MAKDRSRNPEKVAAERVLLGLEGRRVPNVAPAHKVCPTGGRSENYALVELSADLVAKRRPNPTAAQFRLAFDLCITRRKGHSWGWMGSECASRVYGGHHGCGWLLAWLYGNAETRECAAQWLTFTIAMCEASAAPEGRCLLVGQRSAARPQPVWWDGLLAAARGADPERWRKAGQWGWPQRTNSDPEARVRAWQWFVLERFRGEVGRLGAFVPRGEAAFELLAEIPFLLRTEYHWLHRDGQLVATWTDRTANGNTAPMLAGAWLGGGIHWLPVDGGIHVRGGKGPNQGNDRATCALVGNRLVYAARLNKPAAIALPPGEYVHRSSATGYRPEVLVI